MKSEKIKQTYMLWKDAVIKGDVDCLNRVYADNFSWTNNMGITNCKTKILKKASSYNIQYLSWQDENIHITFDGEHAILKSTQILKLKVFQQSINAKLNVTVQFTKRNNNWLLESIQESY